MPSSKLGDRDWKYTVRLDTKETSFLYIFHIGFCIKWVFTIQIETKRVKGTMSNREPGALGRGLCLAFWGASCIPRPAPPGSPRCCLHQLYLHRDSALHSPQPVHPLSAEQASPPVLGQALLLLRPGPPGTQAPWTPPHTLHPSTGKRRLLEAQVQPPGESAAPCSGTQLAAHTHIPGRNTAVLSKHCSGMPANRCRGMGFRERGHLQLS